MNRIKARLARGPWPSGLAHLIGLPVLNALLLGTASLIQDVPAEMVLRGCRFKWRLKEVVPPIFVGRNVIIRGAHTISVGRNVIINDGVVLNSAAFLAIGDDTHIDVGTTIYGHGGVRIGSGVAIASGVRIYSQSNTYGPITTRIVDAPRQYAEVRIGDDVWIGANAVVLPGVEIGDHSVIGAGSIVRESIPACSIAVGSPARVAKLRPPL